jgi:hypothetical protein
MLTMMQRLFEKLFRKQKERIEITIETNESWEVHSLQKTVTNHCQECGKETVFVPTDLGMQIAQANEEEITNLLTAGKLHLTDSAEEKKLVCLQSLKKKFGTDKRKFNE